MQFDKWFCLGAGVVFGFIVGLAGMYFVALRPLQDDYRSLQRSYMMTFSTLHIIRKAYADDGIEGLERIKEHLEFGGIRPQQYQPK